MASRKRRRIFPVSPDTFERLPLVGRPLDAGDKAEHVDELVGVLRELIETRLTDAQRKVIELYFFEDRTQEEIASELGISQQSVSRHLFGAVRDGQRVGGAIRRLQKLFADSGVEWV